MLRCRAMRWSGTEDFQTAVWTVAPRQETSRGSPTLTEIRRDMPSTPGEQLLQLRRETFEKNLPMACPTARIRQIENRTAPARPSGGALNIIPDGFDQSHNSRRFQMADSPGERGLACKTGRAARVCVEAVD